VDRVLRHPPGGRLFPDADLVQRGGSAEILQETSRQETRQREAIQQGEDIKVAQAPRQGPDRIVQGGRTKHPTATPVRQADLDLILPTDDVVDVEASLVQEVREGRVEPKDTVES